MYDLSRVYFDYEGNRFMFRLDPCEKQGRPLYVETDYVALSLLWQVLNPSLSVPLIHHVVMHWIHGMSYSIDSLFVDAYTASTYHFRTKLVLKGDKVIHLECRLSDGVALAIVSACCLYVARTAEEEYYSNSPPDQRPF